jgi:hypothetical protein
MILQKIDVPIRIDGGPEKLIADDKWLALNK